MDDKVEKRRLQRLAAVKRYYRVHVDERKRMSMTWPVALLKKIDEAVRETGVSRQAWVFRVCEAELARLKKGHKRKAE